MLGTRQREVQQKCAVSEENEEEWGYSVSSSLREQEFYSRIRSVLLRLFSRKDVACSH